MIFRNFLAQMSRFSYWEADWVLAIKSKHFKGFPWNFLIPKILSLKSFDNFWDNFYFHFLSYIHLWRRSVVVKRQKIYKTFAQGFVYYMPKLCTNNRKMLDWEKRGKPVEKIKSIFRITKGQVTRKWKSLLHGNCRTIEISNKIFSK